MKKYITFLRGINVGNIRIKMTDLTRAFEDLGFKNVKTYLQTGNIVFHTEGSALEDIKRALEKKLSDTFNYDAYALIYEFDILSEIIAQYPFESIETHHAYVIFVDDATIFDNLKTLAQGLGVESKWIAFGNQVIYWQVKIGSTLDTPFAKIIAKAKYKANTTTRNKNTLEKMI